jgi:PAS domain S-box-containing protein
VENLPLGVVHSTVDGLMLYQNVAARKIYGYTADEWQHVPLSELYVNPAEMVVSLEKQRAAVFEYPMRHKSGRQIWIRGTSNLVDNEASGRVEVHGYFEDVSEQKDMETQNVLLEEQFRQAQKMEAVGQLTAGIAHNFNNMLQGISGNLQLAILDAEGEMQTMLGDADRVTHRAAGMVRQLMMFSRQGIQPVLRAVQLEAVVQNTVDICVRTFERKISIEVEVDAQIHVVADPGLLQQVFLNMLINARDAVLEQGVESPWIRIHAVVAQEADPEVSGHLPKGCPIVQITIDDNGIGMDPETQQRIFEPFFTTKPVDCGTGLGLATVSGIITQHEGWVRCDSRLHKGTSFHVYLPLCEAADDIDETPDSAPKRRGKPTLLVIDDEELIRETTSRLFDHEGYQVLVAESGLAGLEMLERQKGTIDLVYALHVRSRSIGGVAPPSAWDQGSHFHRLCHGGGRGRGGRRELCRSRLRFVTCWSGFNRFSRAEN